MNLDLNRKMEKFFFYYLKNHGMSVLCLLEKFQNESGKDKEIFSVILKHASEIFDYILICENIEVFNIESHKKMLNTKNIDKLQVYLQIKVAELDKIEAKYEKKEKKK